MYSFICLSADLCVCFYCENQKTRLELSVRGHPSLGVRNVVSRLSGLTVSLAVICCGENRGGVASQGTS